MSNKLVIYENVVLEGGLKQNASNPETIIPFKNISVSEIAIDPSNVVLATEAHVEDLVKSSLVTSHKSIAGEFKVADEAAITAAVATYTSGGDLTLVNGRVFNNGNATAGEVIFFVPDAGATVKSEEYIVGSTKELIPLTTNNVEASKVTSIESEIAANKSNIATNASDIASAKKDINNKVDESTYTSEQAAQDALILANTNGRTANTQSITTLEPKVNANTAATTDYFDNKADFVRVQDIAGAIDVDADIVGTESGTDVTFDLSGLDLSKLTADKLAAFKFDANNGTDPSEYVSDSYNNGTGTVNDLLGNDSVTVLSTDKLLTVSGLSTQERATLVNDYKLKLVSQLAASVGNGIDHTARSQAAAAQATANTANTQATTNKSNIAANTSAIASKQDATDNSLLTTSKSVVGAINEVKAKADNNEADIAELNKGNFDVKGDGTVVVHMFNADGTLTDSFKALLGLKTDAEINALIDAKLNEVMSVTFDDSSTGAFKIGK